MQDAFGPVVATVALAAMVGWIVWVRASSHRHTQQIRLMTDFHTRLLDRIGPAKDFGEFLETEGGKSFMNSITAEPVKNRDRFLRSLQIGVILSLLGGALLLLGRLYPYEEGFPVLGVLVLAVGVGFLISSWLGFKLGAQQDE